MSTHENMEPLGNVCRIVPGYAFRSADFTDAGVPVVKIKNIRSDCTVDVTDADCIPESLLSERLSKFLLKDGDILIAMTGATAGKVGRIRCNRPVLLNQRVAKIEPVNADPGYIWSVVSSPDYQTKFFNLADGAAQPNMSGAQIESVPIPLPPLAEQRRIAGILSAYDDLIETNQRRIRILEEMGRSLYREWFVNFRFHGYDHRRIDSPLGPIPRHWHVKKLGEVLELHYGKALKKEERNGGKVPVFGSSGVVGYHDAKLAAGPGLVLGRKGNVGSVFWSDEDFFVIDTAFYVSSTLPLRYLYYVLPTMNFINGDAAVPGLSRSQAYSLYLLIPDASTLETFCRIADSLEQHASCLRRQAQALYEARAVLLMKLL